MTVDKMSVSLAPSLSTAVREAAELSGETLSGWLAEAAQTKLRAQALDEFLEVWENENGAITDEEVRDAASRLGPLDSAPRSFNFVKVTASGGAHDALISAIARIIEGGRSVLVPEQDLPDLSKLVKAGERISFEMVEVRVSLPTE
jgi:hypothetical protein